ncbi:MAG TPA: DUF423 domain-containing protein [Opitutaceae bacterium]|nr:DUF423 domain-containing protein [Opitutaceae bacterium]
MNFFRKIKLVAGGLGLSGVALGAFGAHALNPALTARGTVALWEKAVIYHLVHAVAVLAAALAPSARPWLARAAVCWSLGVVCFSGSLYALALGAPVRWLWPVTPAGGLLFLLGWSLVLVDSLRPDPLEKN